ncbi:MAG: 2-oxo acid dehydrogenase subunit E2 [Candidatus Obscuribacterales bacterium]|nr:2-oxo acid dehydrogenase subunit E2 [Candidatus Obscuribacterales bacterium]
MGSNVAGLLYVDFDMAWADEFRLRLKKAGQNVTITAMLLKAIAIAQREHPESRTEWLPFGRRVTYNNITAGFTVERMVDGQATVFLGEIESPIEKSLEKIALELKEHAGAPIKDVQPLFMQNAFSFLPTFVRGIILEVGKRVPFGRMQCQKATFGLTTLGKFGIDSLNCPCLCACSFSIGTAEKRPIVRDGEVVVQSVMTVGLNYDRRAIDSSNAARFLDTVQKLMEGGLQEWLPESLLLASPQEDRKESLTAV